MLSTENVQILLEKLQVNFHIALFFLVRLFLFFSVERRLIYPDFRVFEKKL